MRRWVLGLIAVGFFLAIMLHGGGEVDEQAFVISIGVDRADTDEVTVILEIPALTGDTDEQSGGSSSSGSGSNNYRIVETRSHGVIDAMETLSTTIPNDLNFSQTLQIIISEELARDAEFSEVLEDLLTLEGLRQSAALIICRNGAKEYIKAQKPYLGTRLSEDIKVGLKLYDNLGYIPIVHFGHAVRMNGRGTGGGWQDVLLPLGYASEAPKDSSKTGGSQPGGGDAAQPEGGQAGGGQTGEAQGGTEEEGGGRDATINEKGRILDSLAGEMQGEDGQKRTDLLGAAVIKQGRMIGTLTGLEMQFVAFLTGNMKQFTYYAAGEYYRIEQRPPVRTWVVQEGDRWTLKISGSVRVSRLRNGMVDIQGVQEAFDNDVLRVIGKLQMFGSDPVGFEGKAVRSVASLSQWDETIWLEMYQNATAEVQTKIIVGEQT